MSRPVRPANPSRDVRRGPTPRRPTPDTPKSGQIRLYGRHAVTAALANPDRPLHRLLVTESVRPSLEPAAQARGIPIQTVPAERIAQLLAPDTPHQGLLLEAGPLPPRSLAEIEPSPDRRSIILALDQVSDPRNLGAILRTAAALGVRGVVLPGRRSADLSGACAKAASGALDIVPIIEVVNLARALAELKERGYWTVGLDAAAESTLDALDLPQQLVLVLGSEGEGLRRLVADNCDYLARLAIEPVVESLNVSVAAGIALYLLSRSLHRHL